MGSFTPDQLIAILCVLALIVVPALAISARLAIRPVVDAIIRLRGSFESQIPDADRRLAALEQRMERMEGVMERIAAATEFDARLTAGVQQPAAASAPPAVSGTHVE